MVLCSKIDGMPEKDSRALHEYRNKDVIVLAIPKGGVEVGYHVAEYLNAELSVVIVRKLPIPGSPEAGFGAIAEDGSKFIFEDAKRWIGKDEIDEIAREQKREIKRRIEVLRKGKPLPAIKHRIVILIDDGIAMGSTMRASINLCRNKKAKKIIAAVPVAGRDAADKIRELADELVVLEMPPFFRAVAQVYRNWYDVSDEEVNRILAAWEEDNKRGDI